MVHCPPLPPPHVWSKEIGDLNFCPRCRNCHLICFNIRPACLNFCATATICHTAIKTQFCYQKSSIGKALFDQGDGGAIGTGHDPQCRQKARHNGAECAKLLEPLPFSPHSGIAEQSCWLMWRHAPLKWSLCAPSRSSGRTLSRVQSCSLPTGSTYSGPQTLSLSVHVEH